MKVYRIFAYLIAAEALVQTAAIALAVFGLDHWIDNGGVADKAAFEGHEPNFTGVVGFTIHGVNGTLIIPLLSLAFLIVSFFVKAVPGESGGQPRCSALLPFKCSLALPATPWSASRHFTV